MSYQMPGRYSNDDPDSGGDNESVDVSIDAEYVSESEYSEEEEEEIEQPKKPRRRGSHSNTRGGDKPRRLPQRSKSFQDDGLGKLKRPPKRSESTSGGPGRSRGLPRRSKTFDSNRNSIRMPRRETSTLDKEAIASNRARRLRAMGDGGKSGGPVRLMRMSESIRSDSKKNRRVSMMRGTFVAFGAGVCMTRRSTK